MGQHISRNKFLLQLVENLYSRTEIELGRGQFRVKGDTVDIYVAYADFAIRVVFWGDEIESIETFDPLNNITLDAFSDIQIFPANIFVTSPETIRQAILEIQDDLTKQVEFFKELGKHLEAKRLDERTNFDLEMMRELGYCSGIENYSRYFDRRDPGTRPFCLIDYFPDDFLMIIDESHVTIPQIRAMYGGDRSRKINLVEHGFRLPAAMDNRPLKFEEFESLTNQVVYTSATPADYELGKSEGLVIEQVIRPTGLLDPLIHVRPSMNQIDDLMEEIQVNIERKERTLVTTLTKRMAEELHKYLNRFGLKTTYIHSDVDTLERVDILRDLRLGIYDVLVGVNLLREGLDLPEVSLVAILDADKEGFLRSERSLVQTVGRAARNINGRVIMYADKITDSMKRTIDETNRRREKQTDYNTKNNITPKQIESNREQILERSKVVKGKQEKEKTYVEPSNIDLAADPVISYMSAEELDKAIVKTRKEMEDAAKELNFLEAGRLRDEMYALERLRETK